MGSTAEPAGSLNASAVEITNVEMTSIHALRKPKRNPVAMIATQIALIRSVATMIGFFFFPSTQAPASG